MKRGVKWTMAAWAIAFGMGVGAMGCGGPDVGAGGSGGGGDGAGGGAAAEETAALSPFDPERDAPRSGYDPCAYGTDSDGDEIIDVCDNCPHDYNPHQTDTDGDGKGDKCDHEKPPPPPPEDEEEGRMTGGGSVFTEDGMRVTHGFQLRCDEDDERQNLEINWGIGENFHLLDLTDADCDDTALDERPPAAGFDTFEGEGTGLYNGEPAEIEFTFTDDGEPGRNDTATIVITSGGVTVLEVSGELEFGNHQAHRN